MVRFGMEQFSYLIHGSMLFIAGLVIGLGGGLLSLRRHKVDHDELERLRNGDRTLAADLPQRADGPELNHATVRRAVPAPVQAVAPKPASDTAKPASQRGASTQRSEPVLSASQAVPLETRRADTLLAAGESATGDASMLTRDLRRALLSGGEGVDSDPETVADVAANKNASSFQS